MAFADEIFSRKPNLKITIIDRRPAAGGHWNDAYPFVKLHQPAAFYGVNSLELGKGNKDLSSKTEILKYYEKVVSKFRNSNRVEVLFNHNYLGNGEVEDLARKTANVTYEINKRLVDASYMKVEVPSTHPPKYAVEEGVPIIPINGLTKQYDQWNKFYVIGNGKTGMDAVLYLLDQGVQEDHIFWISPNQVWLFNRSSLQVGKVAKEILNHGTALKKAKEVDDIFLEMEQAGGIVRIDEKNLPSKWRCATVSKEELSKLRRIKNVIAKGRIIRITNTEIVLQQGKLVYDENSIFVDCSANGLSRRKAVPVFSEGKITLQSILFCQQVFSAATLARLELTRLSDKRKNGILPIPHPELKEDWPQALVEGIRNVQTLHFYIPLWMFRSRLNFMSHESIFNYFSSSIKALYLVPSLQKAAKHLQRK